MASIKRQRFFALRDIDIAAGAARLRYITDVPGQQAVYLLKMQEAQAYAAAHAVDQGATVPPHVAAEAAATGQTAIDVAANVIALATLWNEQLSPVIEGARLGGKAVVGAANGVDDAATAAAIESARVAAIAALEAI